ncbi:cobalt ECF transporter T component CbiQ [Desulfovibrio sp. OttesenSCG-928-G15]|nr:cobalt ECF transporter T component CbiQ [Desulfovibrio sp. OttesenSCG-928-G15]
MQKAADSGTRNAPVDRLAPGVRLTGAFAAALCFSLLGEIRIALACLGLAVFVCAAAMLPVRYLLRRLLAVNFFIAFLWLTVPLVPAGREALFTLGPVACSLQGLRLCLLISVKANAIFLIFTALTHSLSISRMGSAMESLGIPARLVQLFLFTYRYIDVIAEEWQRLQTAARLRGFVPKTSLHTYKTVANMLGLVFVNSFDRSKRIYEAMLLRGFAGSFRTVTPVTARPADYVALGGFLTVLCAFAVVDCVL